MIRDLGGGQKAKKERVLTNSEDKEWRNFIILDLRQVSLLSIGWWDGTDYLACVGKWDINTEINPEICREEITGETSA